MTAQDRPPPSSDVALDVRDLRMRYGTKDVLTGVSFAAHRGEVLALLGPNGAGKTTTIEILEGFRMRSAGEVLVLGRRPRARRTRPGAHGSAWCSSRGVTTAGGGCVSCSGYLARFYAPYSTAEVARPWDVDELIGVVGLTEHAKPRCRRSRAGSVAAWTWRSGSSGGRSWCSSTSRRRASTRTPAGSSTTWCTAWRTSRTRRSCSRRTTSTRPRSWPTGSWCSTTARSSPTGPRNSSRVS